MKRTATQPLGKILEAFFEDNPHIADKLAEARLISYWNNGMSPAITRFTGDLFIRKRVLYVQLKSAVLKNELMMLREQMIEKLNREVGRRVIDGIVFC